MDRDFESLSAVTGLGKLKSGDRVAVALSGGVDSRQCAVRLLEGGAAVEAFHLLLHENGAGESPDLARQAAAGLGLPFHLLDLRKEFKVLVIEPFIEAYKSGRTPNPCLLCNPAIKFGLLLDEVLKRGFDYLATGHYAAQSPDGFFLMRGQDPLKDQSYFLSRLSSAQIRKAIWPLALVLKEEVKDEARRGHFRPPADSQEICFVPGDYRDFLKSRLAPEEEGDFVSLDGRPLGVHKGLSHYTVGQRKGLGVPGPEPYYVIKIDATQNQIILGTKRDIYQDEFMAEDLVLNTEVREGQSFQALVQLRSRHKAAPALVTVLARNQARVKFMEGQSSITPGQAAAFYRGAVCLGSGQCL